MTPLVEGFLMGAICVASVAIGTIFFKYWRRTRDFLFLAFGLAFLIEGLNRVSLLFADRPNEGSQDYYIVRLLSFLLILAGILKKNYERR